MEYDDILAMAETKINESYSTAQFLLARYYSPYRLNKSLKGGAILVQKSSIPSYQLNSSRLPFKIQAISFKLNLRKEKWLVIPIYKPPLESLSGFLDFLTNIIDSDLRSCNNVSVMGDFNSQPTNSILNNFMEANGF